MRPPDNLDRQRALRYISHPELARARMAPFWHFQVEEGS